MSAFVLSRFSWRFNLLFLLICSRPATCCPPQVIITPAVPDVPAPAAAGSPERQRDLCTTSTSASIAIHVAFQLGFCTFVLSNYMKTLPHEMTEARWSTARRCSGSTARSSCRSVRPALAALATLESTFIYNDFFWALLLMKTGERMPITSALNNLKGNFFVDNNLIAAGAIIVALAHDDRVLRCSRSSSSAGSPWARRRAEPPVQRSIEPAPAAARTCQTRGVRPVRLRVVGQDPRPERARRPPAGRDCTVQPPNPAPVIRDATTPGTPTAISTSASSSGELTSNRSRSDAWLAANSRPTLGQVAAAEGASPWRRPGRSRRRRARPDGARPGRADRRGARASAGRRRAVTDDRRLDRRQRRHGPLAVGPPGVVLGRPERPRHPGVGDDEDEVGRQRHGPVIERPAVEQDRRPGHRRRPTRTGP